MQSRSIILNFKCLISVGKLKGLCCRFALLIIISTSFSSYAIKLSAYRIFLEPEKRVESFVIYNPEAEAQECSLKIIHNNFDEFGNMTLHREEELPENSAKKWFRYSPRTFTLSGARSQTVRFSLRRKAKTTPAEYRSYLNIDCAALPDKEERAVSLQPKLIVNIPIIVRTGALSAQANIDGVTFDNNQLNFNLKRKGERSIYGDLTVVNRKTNELIVNRPGIYLYPETHTQAFSFDMKEKDTNNLLIRYKENSQFGGDILIEKQVN